MFEEEDGFISLKQPVLTAQVGSTVYNYHMDEPIGDPSNYRDLITVLSMATEADTINLYINGPGGDLNTTMQLCNAIASSSATVVGHLQGSACSGHAFIFLACHEWVVYPVSYVMLHTSTGGTYGTGNNNHAAIANLDQIMSALMDYFVVPFMSKEEVEQRIFTYKDDVYFSGEDLSIRLDKLSKYRQAAIKEYMESN
ncbi:ATP-dependent Clp protease proteolytic subunit [Proteus phage RP7]|nr:ATP-dependent Clp protease proteolytic subunit [Proteus phage RP7]